MKFENLPIFKLVIIEGILILSFRKLRYFSGEDAGEGRYVETPLSFYDLPQNNVKPVRSNVQLYFL